VDRPSPKFADIDDTSNRATLFAEETRTCCRSSEEWSKHVPAVGDLSDSKLGDKIVDIHTKSHRTYGAPRITPELAGSASVSASAWLVSCCAEGSSGAARAELTYPSAKAGRAQLTVERSICNHVRYLSVEHPPAIGAAAQAPR
jgi:hypothetical protein